MHEQGANGKLDPETVSRITSRLGAMLREAERGEPDPRWKKDCPPSKLLVLAWQGHIEVFDGFGPEVYYMSRIDDLNAWVEGIALDDGVWELDITIRSGRYDTPDGPEYDEELEVLSTKPASKDLVRAHFNGEHVWDTSLWLRP